jgi:hypothetical protein
LNRAEARKLLPGINDRIVNAFLSKLEAKAILIINVPEEFHYDRDPDDEMYINFAIVADHIQRRSETVPFGLSVSSHNKGCGLYYND